MEHPKPSTLPLFIKSKGITVTFKQVDDQEWREVRNKFAPISEDWQLFSALELHYYPKHQFDLPRIYMALFTFFGPQNSYDDYKCSFSYKFELAVAKQDRCHSYALAIADIKSGFPGGGYSTGS